MKRFHIQMFEPTSHVNTLLASVTPPHPLLARPPHASSSRQPGTQHCCSDDSMMRGSGHATSVNYV